MCAHWQAIEGVRGAAVHERVRERKASLSPAEGHRDLTSRYRAVRSRDGDVGPNVVIVLDDRRRNVDGDRGGDRTTSPGGVDGQHRRGFPTRLSSERGSYR